MKDKYKIELWQRDPISHSDHVHEYVTESDNLWNAVNETENYILIVRINRDLKLFDNNTPEINCNSPKCPHYPYCLVRLIPESFSISSLYLDKQSL